MNIKEAAKQMDAQRSKCRAVYLAFGIGLVAAAAMIALQQFKAAIALLILLIPFYFVFVRPEMARYKTNWREICVRLFTEDRFAPITYRYHAKAADLPELGRHTPLPLSDKGKVLVHSLVRGSRAGINVAFADLTIPVGDGRGMTFHSGCWMAFSFDCACPAPLRVQKDEVLFDGDYERWITQSEGLVRCDAPEDMPPSAAFYAPSAQQPLPADAAAPLKTLLKSMPQTGLVEIDRDGLRVFLPHRLLNRQPPTLKNPIVEEVLSQATFPEIDDAYMLALALKKPQAENN